jgi:hypothetical protein
MVKQINKFLRILQAVLAVAVMFMMLKGVTLIFPLLKGK